jgi:hypothetical protein
MTLSHQEACSSNEMCRTDEYCADTGCCPVGSVCEPLPDAATGDTRDSSMTEPLDGSPNE